MNSIPQEFNSNVTKMKHFLTNKRVLHLFKSDNAEESRKAILEKKNILFDKLKNIDIKKAAKGMLDDFKKWEKYGEVAIHNEKDSVVSKEIEQQKECFKNRLKGKIQRMRNNQKKLYGLKNKSSRKKKKEES